MSCQLDKKERRSLLLNFVKKLWGGMYQRRTTEEPKKNQGKTSIGSRNGHAPKKNQGKIGRTKEGERRSDTIQLDICKDRGSGREEEEFN